MTKSTGYWTSSGFSRRTFLAMRRTMKLLRASMTWTDFGRDE
jgi:hypothetical protein